RSLVGLRHPTRPGGRLLGLFLQPQRQRNGLVWSASGKPIPLTHLLALPTSDRLDEHIIEPFLLLAYPGPTKLKLTIALCKAHAKTTIVIPVVTRHLKNS